MTFTSIQDRVSKTAAATGTGVDVSALTGDWTLKLHIESMADSVTATLPVVRFAFVDTVNSFTASLTGPTASFSGTLGSSYDKVVSWKKADFPDLRIGTPSALLRLDLTKIESGGTIVYNAWIES